MSEMKIRLLKQGWMTTSGSSLLRMMQNVNTPALDLIVRESLQNSLDAAKSKRIGDKVKVAFTYGDFDVDLLSQQFEGIGSELRNIQCNGEHKFLAISDRETKGLIGNLNGIFQSDEENQNLGKLVFQIMKPQDEEGAGGSWGIGKTVYYRLGIGLVIYYSRIKLDNGDYQNRLVAALVENEKEHDGLLSSYDNNLGAAFFGKANDDEFNQLEAITDDEYIKNFLKIFGMKLYSNDVTGTSIIIPFIDEKKTLNNNVSDEEETLWWADSIENYLKVSILRWYFPRLSMNYPYGARLVATVNGDPVQSDKDTPYFTKMRELYDAAFSTNIPKWITKKEIRRHTNVKENVIGWFMYGKLTNEDLGITKHLPSEYKYAGCEAISADYNTPIICFCRKPGMIMNYKVDWAVKNEKSEHVVGLFVINSNNEITHPAKVNLDDYLRKGEKSDHTIWVDYSIVSGARQVNIVNLIYSKIRQELEHTYGQNQVVSGQGEINTVLAHKFGKKFLPDENYGDHSNGRRTGGRREGGGQVIKKNGNQVNFINRDFKGPLIIDYEVVINTKVSQFSVESMVNTISKSISASKWEKNGTKFPLNIEKVALRCTKIDNKDVASSGVMISSNKDGQFEFFKVHYESSEMGQTYGIIFDCENDFKPISFTLRIAFTSIDRALQSNFEFDFKED